MTTVISVYGKINSSRILGLALVLTAFIANTAWAHGIVGQRYFPTTFAVDDPFISDGFSLLYNHFMMNDPGGGPRVKTTSFDFTYSKRILPNFGFEIDDSYQHMHIDGDGTVTGFSNVAVGVKYQFYANPDQETILSAGLSSDIGDTGTRRIGSNSLSPMSRARAFYVSPAFYFGKGFGNLPDYVGWLRPAAITGIIGLNFPTSKTMSTPNDQGGENVTRNPITLTWAFTAQYSLMYLQSYMKDVGLSAPFNRMIVVVEVPLESCMNVDCKYQTIGTVNPGIFWVGKFTQFGLAAQIPMNPSSGATIGILGQFHVFIDDLFPKSIGRPIFP
jgi:hypothetical protein